MARIPRPTAADFGPWRHRLHTIIFEADTPAGKAFDVALLIAIVLSVLTVMLESVQAIGQTWGPYLLAAEWTFTILFTIEYVLRLMSVTRPSRYAISFFGIVDLLAIVPTYLSVVLPGSQALIVIRTLRLVRVFRVLKLTHFLSEADALVSALRRTRARIAVFLVFILATMVIMGSLMYLLEGGGGGNDEFTSIPRGVYWAIVTMTTVGYGDLTPQTTLGQAVAALAMILGYAIIIVPIGIFSVELAGQNRPISTQACPACSREGHDVDAKHCKFCGEPL